MAKFSEIFGVDKGVQPGSVNLNALTDEVRFGIMPVGTVFPIMTNIAGALAAPGSGTVVDGLMLCDGAVIPGGNTLSGNVPDLSSDVFLQGSAAAGATGGSNVMVDHVHAHALTYPDHVHTHALTYPNHTHTHNIGTANDSHTHTNPVRATVGGFTNGTTNLHIVGGSNVATNFGQSLANNGDTHNHSITGGITSSGGGSVGGSITSSGGGAISGSVGSGASAGTTENRPKYVAVQYMIRVV